MDRIKNIKKMEAYLDETSEVIRRLETAISDFSNAQKKLTVLEAYYSSGEWRADYEADERGELPDDLKRGVLSEDALYDLLVDNERLKKLLGE